MKNRRKLFISSVRYAVLGLIGLAGFKLTDTQSKSVQECLSDGICSRCKHYNGCGLPQALSRKKSLAKVADVNR